MFEPGRTYFLASAALNLHSPKHAVCRIGPEIRVLVLLWRRCTPAVLVVRTVATQLLFDIPEETWVCYIVLLSAQHAINCIYLEIIV